MQQRSQHRKVTPTPQGSTSVRRAPQRMARGAVLLAASLFGWVAAAGVGCGDDDSTDFGQGGSAGSGGRAGAAGAAGRAGTAGSAGSAGSGGAAGAAGAAGTSGSGGTAGAAGAAGAGGAANEDPPDSGVDGGPDAAVIVDPPSEQQVAAEGICARLGELTDCDAPADCVSIYRDTIMGDGAAGIPAGCEDEFQAYYTCLGTTATVASFFCPNGDNTAPGDINIGSTECPDEEAAWFDAIGINAPADPNCAQ
jgi:hypothetical protein